MEQNAGWRIAYIVSMQHGLDAWTYREIQALTQQGVEIDIYPLKYGRGPYMPAKDWRCRRFSKLLVGLKQPLWLVRRPTTYLRLLAEAIRTRSIVDFLLGVDFAQDMAARKVDMIHCVYGDHKFFIGYYCKRILGIPLSVALYGYDLRANPNWAMFHRAIRVADAIVVNCDFNRQLLTNLAGPDLAERAKVIRHYAEIPSGEHHPDVRLLIVGGFAPRKGHDVLFQAVRALGAEADNLEVWVVGYPGPVDVQQMARDCGIENKVRVFGSLPDQGLDYLYRACDVFCLPSRTDRRGVAEGLPVALIEAMAYAKPVIASRIAGIPELVEAILVDEGDVAGLAQAIQSLLHDPERRRALGARNREIVESRYSKRNVLLMRDLFLETLDHHGKVQS